MAYDEGLAAAVRENKRLRELLAVARSGLLAVFECEGVLPEGVRYAAWAARANSDPGETGDDKRHAD